MSEEIASADALLTELAKLRNALDLAMTKRDQWRASLLRAQQRYCELEGRHQADHRRMLMAEYAAVLLQSELVLLRELAADVARWRSTGGDPRDMADVDATMDRITQVREGEK